MRPTKRHPDQRLARRRTVSPAARRRDGKLSIIAIPWIVGMLVLTGLVGNSGQTAVQKIEVQNAADAAAYSTALWQARGLNALTTSNHLIGEFTSLVVLHEALGGPELDQGSVVNTSENSDLQSKLANRIDQEPAHPDLATYLYSYYGMIDKPIVERIAKRVHDTDMVSAATIYDARLTLKSCTILLLDIKLQANEVARIGMILRQIPLTAAIGAALETAALAVHIAATLELVEVGREWIILEVLEKIGQETVALKRMAREKIIPALSRYSDLIAGRFGPSPVNASAIRTLDRLRSAHKVNDLSLFPSPETGASQKLQLPVMPEPLASNSGNSSRPESLWSGKDDPSGPLEALVKLLKSKWLEPVRAVVKFLNDLDGLISIPGGSGNFPLSMSPVDLTDLNLIPDQTWPGNPSSMSLPEFDWRAESRSQLTRGSYPYVDLFRKSVRKEWMSNSPWSATSIPRSMAAQYFTHWTNRYNVTEANRIRRTNSHMYVLKDMTPTTKGNEPWTTNDRRAEDLFSVTAIAVRTRKPPSVLQGAFKEANRHDVVTISQALTYNANGRELTGNTQLQPNTGWDTLNWHRVVQAPEWGDHDPGQSNERLLFDIIEGRTSLSGSSTRVQLNWQAKLIPVTKTRLGDTLNGKPPAEAKQALQSVIEHFGLVTH